MPTKAAKTPPTPVEWRIGEVAKLTGVTTRTLRYWEELELLQPSSYRPSGERLYSPADVARVTRIRNLQEFLGFSLAEVRTVLNAGDVDVLDRVRSELKRRTSRRHVIVNCSTRGLRPTTSSWNGSMRRWRFTRFATSARRPGCVCVRPAVSWRKRERCRRHPPHRAGSLEITGWTFGAGLGRPLGRR